MRQSLAILQTRPEPQVVLVAEQRIELHVPVVGEQMKSRPQLLKLEQEAPAPRATQMPLTQVVPDRHPLSAQEPAVHAVPVAASHLSVDRLQTWPAAHWKSPRQWPDPMNGVHTRVVVAQ